MTTCRKNLFLLLYLISCLSSSNAFSQEAPTPQDLNELKFLLENEMERQHVAGMMLTLVTRDSVLYAGGLGYADVEQKVPVTDRHLFRQASIAKLFTALGILSLVDEGKLTVYTKLKDVAPEVPIHNEWEDTDPITMAHLMEHSTGFYDKSPLEEFNFEREKLGGLETLKVFQDQMESRWRPGERFSYSAVNYAILAYVIEKVSGMPFEEYMREKVFSRLGMPYANVSLAGDAPGTYSSGYVWRDGRFQLVPHRPQYNPGYGSLNASAVDMAHALQAYLHDWQTPKGQFLTTEMLHDSEAPRTYLSAQAGLHSTYAFGNESREVNGRVFRGHSGSVAGYLSNFLYNRELGLGFAFSINTFNPGFHRYATDLIGRFLTRHLDEPKAPSAYPLQAAAVDPFLGYYHLSSSSDLYTGYFQGLLTTFKLEQQQDGLLANYILGGSMNWKAAGSSSLLFTNEWAKDPRIMLLRDRENRPVIVEDTMYYEKVSAFEAWAPVVLLLLCLLIMVSSVMIGAISVVLLLLKRKIVLNVFLLRLSPVLVTLGLLLSIWTIPQFTDRVTAGVPIEGLTYLWTIGRCLFAFFTLATVVLLVLRWRSLRSGWLRGYMAAVTFCGCYFFAVLVESNWY